MLHLSYLILGESDSDVIWWLGSVPCRNVKFIGILVGTRAYEKRTTYTGNNFCSCSSQIHAQCA